MKVEISQGTCITHKSPAKITNVLVHYYYLTVFQCMLKGLHTDIFPRSVLVKEG